MKTIEKTTKDGDIQIFEIIETKKELKQWIRDTFWDSLYSEYKTGIWEDGDSSVSFYNKDGKYHGYFEGDTVKRFNVANIEKLVSINSATTVIYGDVDIIYNEHYGDWETNLD
jgi:hypothetical protein